jgi:hypothetical protein
MRWSCDLCVVLRFYFCPAFDCFHVVKVSIEEARTNRISKLPSLKKDGIHIGLSSLFITSNQLHQSTSPWYYSIPSSPTLLPLLDWTWRRSSAASTTNDIHFIFNLAASINIKDISFIKLQEQHSSMQTEISTDQLSLIPLSFSLRPFFNAFPLHSVPFSSKVTSVR